MKSILTSCSIILFTFMSLTSCIDCVDGNGDILTEDRTSNLGEFTEIELNGSFDLDLTQADNCNVQLEGDENILKLITTRVSNGKLIVETKSNHCFSSRSSINVKVSAKNISNVVLSGSGNVFCDSLSTDHLYLRISGSGDMRFNRISSNDIDADIEGSGNIILQGDCTNSNFRIDGSGDVKAYDLKQKNCDITINGSGNIYTFFTENLNGVINGSGNVMYKTSGGSVNIKINGSGSIKKSN